jgi:opacity protein-like surface antigen
MKKLTLTFCVLFALLVVAPAIYADGPERTSGKEKEVMQPAPPVCDFYRAHEWDLSIWGAYAFGGTTGQFDVPNEDPFSTSIAGGPFLKPDQDPFLFGVGEPQLTNPNARINIGQVSQNELFGRDDVFGGGVDVKYFWSRYLGAGLEGVGLAAKTNFAGGGLATITARYPLGRFAPYATGGIGFIDGGSTEFKFFNEKNTFSGGVVTHEREFWTVDPVSNHHLRGLGQIGAGLEFRATCHIGLMADFTWNFVFGQEDHADRFRTVSEQGLTDLDQNGFPLRTRSVIISKADNLIPGHGSDNQDFGMARFGVTFSY